MTLTVTSGTWAFSGSTSTAPVVTMPTTTVAGDLIVLQVLWKQIAATFTTPIGYTFATRNASSAGASYAAGAGDVATAVYYATATAGQAAPSLAALTGGATTNTTGNVMGAVLHVIRATSRQIVVRHATGASLVNNSVVDTAAVPAGIPYVMGDLFLTFSASTNTIGAWSFASSDISIVNAPTFSAPTLAPATAGTSTTGADIAATGIYETLTAVNAATATDGVATVRITGGQSSNTMAFSALWLSETPGGATAPRHVGKWR